MDKDGQSLQIADLLQTDDETPIDAVEQRERIERLYRHLGKLDGRELEIIQRRYGLLDDQPMTQKRSPRSSIFPEVMFHESKRERL